MCGKSRNAVFMKIRFTNVKSKMKRKQLAYKLGIYLIRKCKDFNQHAALSMSQCGLQDFLSGNAQMVRTFFIIISKEICKDNISSPHLFPTIGGDAIFCKQQKQTLSTVISPMLDFRLGQQQIVAVTELVLFLQILFYEVSLMVTW